MCTYTSCAILKDPISRLWELGRGCNHCIFGSHGGRLCCGFEKVPVSTNFQKRSNEGKSECLCERQRRIGEKRRVPSHPLPLVPPHAAMRNNVSSVDHKARATAHDQQNNPVPCVFLPAWLSWTCSVESQLPWSQQGTTTPNDSEWRGPSGYAMTKSAECGVQEAE